MQLTFQPTLTNEEKHIAFYEQDGIPTQASSITAHTPLSDINLNWREKDLPERERTKHVHRLHPYLGKYIPQLVEVFLRKYFRAGQIVLDPFCGSGTTLVQANELGINSIGCDISAFNITLCKAKTAAYNLAEAHAEILDILGKVQQKTQAQSHQLSLWDNYPEAVAEAQDEHPYLTQWFAPQTLCELIWHRDLIPNYRHQDLLKVILSRAARSARLTTHFDLDFPKAPQTGSYYCYKHSRFCAPTKQAFPFLKRYSLDTLTRIEEFTKLRTSAAIQIHHGDSREFEFPTVDGVITSPPYVGLIDYHEQHAYAYHLLGLEDRREKEIGAAKRGASQKARHSYQEDIASVFKRICAQLKPGGRLIVVAADKANLYPEIADLAGVKTEAVVNRHVNRRTGRRKGEFYESIFIWRKPLG